MFEETVCKVGDVAENTAKAFSVKGGKVLIAREKGEFFAVGTKCSHYGAPLEGGVLYKGQIRCPWHAACFSLKTGDIEDFPGIDGIPTYNVTVKGEDIVVSGKLEDLKNNIKPAKLCTRSNDKETFVVVGGGPAGLECALTLREKGFNGRLVMLTEEDVGPYDRTKMSKALNTKVESALLRADSAYKEADIEVLVSSKVTSVDPTKKVVNYGGSNINFQKIFLASGVRARVLKNPGADLPNISYVRNYKDASKIVAMATGKRVVIIGTSFIGMEVASFLNGKASSVTVVGNTDAPFQNVLGLKIGNAIKQLFESKGVVFKTKVNVKGFEGSESGITAVTLDDGTSLPADACIVGVGTQTDIEYLKDSGVAVDKFGNVRVDLQMKTNIDGVYAGGDMVLFPLTTTPTEKEVSIGHWQIAQLHGRVAALNMLGLSTPLVAVPFFWSMLFGKGLRYAGYAPANDIHIVGEVNDLKFVAYFFQDDVVAAVATMGNDPVATLFAAITKDGIKLQKAHILDNSTSWIDLYSTKTSAQK